MNFEDCNPSEIETPDGLSDERLKPQIERLRSLRSAWAALAPSCLTAQARKIAETGRAVTELLVSLSGRAGELDESDLATADRRLDDFEATMQKLISQVPVSQFRSSLPGMVQSGRQALLDLLDTMIAETAETKSGLNLQIGPIDYLITLLCTNAGTSGGQVRFDPVTLTSRVSALCESVNTEDDARLEEIEAEFFAAATMDRDDLREELQQRTLRSRKSELGMAFFAPRILRAVVTYNASLYHRVADEILDSGDWGLIDGIAAPEPRNGQEPAPAQSVFACERFRDIAAAARRRARGEAALPSDEDRIVWALDFDYLDVSERKALTMVSVGTEEDVLGTAILVGLLCRSLAVLSIELQALGIAPDLVSDGWVRELEAAFQEEINHKISNDAYKSACALSELKNKFLLAPLTDQYREQRTASPMPAPPATSTAAATTATDLSAGAGNDTAAVEPLFAQAHPVDAQAPMRPRPAPNNAAPKKESALDLVRSALEENQAHSTQSKIQGRRFDATVLKTAALAALVIALLVNFAGMNRNPDLKSWSTDQLESVSPYLEKGRRNGEGIGPAFVGRIAKHWEGLPRPVREASAEDLVRRLREAGIQQIMIYGSDKAVQIQAIGSQEIQVK